MRLKRAAAAGGALALLVVMGACSENKGTGGDTGADRVQSGSIATDPKESMGPAPEVPGAAKGGTFRVIRETKISHLDPQRVYSFAGLMNAPLYSRFLTTFKDDGSGKVTLVGDLAETPGTDVNKDCKVWEFKIKDGVKFEDGSPITSKEIAYGIARSFDPDLTGGPTYLQEWLANDPQYDTKWNFKANKTSLPPGLTTPDAKTLKFEFAKPHCDLPFAASLPYTAPLKPEKDTGVNLDNQPFSSGPYKITKNTAGTELVMERNENWDPKTDPVRHAYPDKIVWNYGPDAEAGANRVISDSGDDQTALAWNGVPSALIARVTGDSALKQRSVQGQTPSLWRLSINTQRVTDLSVRQALNYAIDRDGFIKVYGGEASAKAVTTLMPPSTIGYEKYDAYPAGPTGNVEKVKELLAGKTPELVLGVGDDNPEYGTQLKTNLEKAGFKITLKTIPADAKLDEVGKKNNPWDLYIDQWAADWPSGAAILPVLFDGRTIKAENNSNTSYVNSDEINKEFDRVLAMPAAEQGKEWAKLDKRIMTELAPAVPLFVEQGYYLHGSKVGGIYLSSIFGYPAFTNVYVKQ
ncbi:peptide/nickel transport system substrate-binding protein [Micromonospora rhizosphaerae]|uniref:Peptide/nickel transport system substrate-binding protein n=1 Tax=Micromonospora rhizosphaerae TaxID=568872 RepID=A0A1C6TE85_9ACTN|nr:ABC transporter substrate-binding protein [Micromonospora rhizosphaerae]SCL39833.1 peptide/nickel transport system substrate-binding protein [Micromonospora rhizosphaerae]